MTKKTTEPCQICGAPMAQPVGECALRVGGKPVCDECCLRGIAWAARQAHAEALKTQRENQPMWKSGVSR